MRIVIQAPGEGTSTTVELPGGELLLWGREPDASAVDFSELAPDTNKIASFVVPQPSVSANHLAAWIDGHEICVRDLGSRNGTWLQLPRNHTVRIPPAEMVAIRLAANSTVYTQSSDMPDVRWSKRSDFGPALAQAIQTWLDARGLGVRISVVSHRTTRRDAESPTRIPLADGNMLQVLALETADDRWPHLLERIWHFVARQNQLFEAEDELASEGLIIASPGMRQVFRQVIDAASRGVRTLLILGPSGSGKEGLARAFHRHSTRSGAFVAQNCAAFDVEFIQSRLFGAEEGAFTGCVRRIIGAVERAHGGTLFLDELGDLPAAVQPMLLRFLDTREYERMGAYGQSRIADVRIVCATNKDLRAASLRHEFRQDLWYRLSVEVVEIPPLRKRPEDILAYLGSRMLGPDVSILQALQPEALALVKGHPWEGNFRELIAFVDRLSAMAHRESVDAEACRRALELGALSPVPPSLAAPLTSPTSSPPPPSPDTGDFDLVQLAATALHAFAEDFHHGQPRTWDEGKEYIEKYFKPVLFAYMSGAAALVSPEQSDVSAVARKVEADRGTVRKQMSRYVERFSR